MSIVSQTFAPDDLSDLEYIATPCAGIMQDAILDWGLERLVYVRQVATFSRIQARFSVVTGPIIAGPDDWGSICAQGCCEGGLG